MKTKLFYSAIALFIVFVGISCSDDKKEENTNILGDYGYESPHILWDYPTDSITFTMGQSMKMSFCVEDLTETLNTMATQYMKSYFIGINFTSLSEMEIGMKMKNGSENHLNAIYKKDAQFIAIQIDTVQLAQLTGLSMPIPPISFSYKMEKEKMTIYLEKEEIITIIAAMGSMIDNLLLEKLPTIPAFSHVPIKVLPEIVKGMKAQAIKIITDSKMEIGFNVAMLYK